MSFRKEDWDERLDPGPFFIMRSFFVKFEAGISVMITGGNNMGCVGVITHRERHPISFEIVHIKDAVGHSCATHLQNVFVIGQGSKPWISLPKGNGIKLNIIEDRTAKMTK